MYYGVGMNFFLLLRSENLKGWNFEDVVRDDIPMRFCRDTEFN